MENTTSLHYQYNTTFLKKHKITADELFALDYLISFSISGYMQQVTSKSLLPNNVNLVWMYYSATHMAENTPYCSENKCRRNGIDSLVKKGFLNKLTINMGTYTYNNESIVVSKKITLLSFNITSDEISNKALNCFDLSELFQMEIYRKHIEDNDIQLSSNKGKKFKRLAEWIFNISNGLTIDEKTINVTERYKSKLLLLFTKIHNESIKGIEFKTQQKLISECN